MKRTLLSVPRARMNMRNMAQIKQTFVEINRRELAVETDGLRLAAPDPLARDGKEVGHRI
jgi:hypothetical protein